MSWRARAFLGTLAVRQLLLGALCVLAPEMFRSTSFYVLRGVAPLEVWGAVLFMTGAQAVGAAISGHEWWARVVLIATSGLTAAWCASFMVSGFHGSLDAPSLPIMWAALAAKDLILSAMPLRTPLEDAVRRLP